MSADPAPLFDWQETTQSSLRELSHRARKHFAPPAKISTNAWANQYRYLAAESSALPGKYNSELTPWVKYIHEALDDPTVWKVVGMKSAQIAWTDGVLNNWIGRCIDVDPSPMIGLFAKQDAAREYGQEKFAPMVTATPRLAMRVDVRTSRKDGNRALFKAFPGGFLKLVGSNSPSNVKSTPAPRVFVEEPDDVSQNVGQQGDSIKLLEERTKTYARRKVVFGGTPSIKGISAIEAAYHTGDQRRFFVPCADCGESHVLDWANVSWQDDPSRQHPVYGHAAPETAVYVCPHCGSAWDDDAKNRAVRNLVPVAARPHAGIVSFAINELYSPFPGSKLARLVERYLEAKRHQENGDDSDLIVFTNSCLGLAYEYQSDAPEVEDLAGRALDYPERTVPTGGLILTAGVDVQHNRLAVIIRAWGRDEESWLVYWGEIFGNPLLKTDPVWIELDRVLFDPIPHVQGGTPSIVRAAGIDASDGAASEAVYHYARTRAHRGVLAIKGDSHDDGSREIFTRPPASIDSKGQRNTKAAKAGVLVYRVGTHKAKDLIAGRIKLTGGGPGRMHSYQSVRTDYYAQLTSEVKAPSRQNRNRKVWQCRAGVRNEALDGEVYALHAARSIKVHLLRPSHWDALERQLQQAPLFAPAPADPAPATPAPPPRPRPPPPPAQKRNQVTRRVAV
jgi:phage terminase large subunit GpA-like protein